MEVRNKAAKSKTLFTLLRLDLTGNTIYANNAPSSIFKLTVAHLFNFVRPPYRLGRGLRILLGEATKGS